MSGDTDLIKLYSARILALAADIPHLGRLDAPDASVKKRSPLCGSTVTVDVTARDGRVAELGQEGKGPVPDAPFDGFEVLLPAVDYKNRHASILLSIEALTEAMETALSPADAQDG